jgi:hypothetical protein
LRKRISQNIGEILEIRGNKSSTPYRVAARPSCSPFDKARVLFVRLVVPRHLAGRRRTVVNNLPHTCIIIIIIILIAIIMEQIFDASIGTEV